MRYDAKWDELLGLIVQDTEYELVGVTQSGDGSHTLLRVYLDKPGGITIDEIASLTREIDMVVGVELEMEKYTLEVSSPGVNRPLFKPQHFQQQVGQNIKVKLGVPIDNRRNFTGILLAATDDEATVLVEDVEYKFPYSDIDEARLVLDINFGKAKNKEAHDEH